MRIRQLLILLSIFPGLVIGQEVGINTTGSAPNASAILDVVSTTKGVLIPRMTTSQMNGISGPTNGLFIYNLTQDRIMYYSSAVSVWTSHATGWSLLGNNDFFSDWIGTSDNEKLVFKTNNTFSGAIDPDLRNTFLGFKAGMSTSTGIRNTAIGASALQLNTTGNNNVAVGDSALYAFTGSGNTRNTAIGSRAGRTTTTGTLNTFVGNLSGYRNTTGNHNTTFGTGALFSNTTGSNNIAIGNEALASATTSNFNLGIGLDAMRLHTSGDFNTVVGWNALSTGNNNTHSIFIGVRAGQDATDGSHNTGIGHHALFSNNGGDDNLAIGVSALELNTTGSHNIGFGFQSLYNNLSGSNNIAIGYKAGTLNTTGNYNIIFGRLALASNTTSHRNVAIGDSSLYTLASGPGENTAVGTRSGVSTTTGNNNVFLGNEAGRSNTTGDFNVAIGHRAMLLTSDNDGNTAIGRNTGDSFDMGNNNTFVGAFADANAAGYFRSSALGHNATVTASNQVRLGTTTTASIGGFQNWSNLSDGRYKKNIEHDVPGLEFVMLLKPVTYRLNVEQLNAHLMLQDSPDPSSMQRAHDQLHSGFIAQDVEAAADQIGFEFSGVDKPQNKNDMYGLRYAEFVVPLVKALQEQQEELRLLEELNAELRSRIEAMR